MEKVEKQYAYLGGFQSSWVARAATILRLLLSVINLFIRVEEIIALSENDNWLKILLIFQKYQLLWNKIMEKSNFSLC